MDTSPSLRVLLIRMCFRDCVALVCVNSGTSIYAGFAVFSVLGFMAKQQGVSVAEVAEQGQ